MNQQVTKLEANNSILIDLGDNQRVLIRRFDSDGEKRIGMEAVNECPIALVDERGGGCPHAVLVLTGE